MDYSPISSEAKAIRKGLPQRLSNTMQDNWTRSPEFHPTKSRAVNYKAEVEHLTKLFAGATILKSEDAGRCRKDQTTSFVVMVPRGDEIHVCTVQVSFKDPMNPAMGQFPITVTRHVVERMAQRRKAGVLQPLIGLFFFHIKHLADGMYEVGCESGMMIAEVNDGETIAVTFVDKDKLRPGQPFEINDYREIH